MSSCDARVADVQDSVPTDSDSGSDHPVILSPQRRRQFPAVRPNRNEDAAATTDAAHIPLQNGNGVVFTSEANGSPETNTESAEGSPLESEVPRGLLRQVTFGFIPPQHTSNEPHDTTQPEENGGNASAEEAADATLHPQPRPNIISAIPRLQSLCPWLDSSAVCYLFIALFMITVGLIITVLTATQNPSKRTDNTDKEKNDVIVWLVGPIFIGCGVLVVIKASMHIYHLLHPPPAPPVVNLGNFLTSDSRASLAVPRDTLPPSYSVALTSRVPSNVIEEEEIKPPSIVEEDEDEIGLVTLNFDPEPPTYDEALRLCKSFSLDAIQRATNRRDRAAARASDGDADSNSSSPRPGPSRPRSLTLDSQPVAQVAARQDNSRLQLPRNYARVTPFNNIGIDDSTNGLGDGSLQTAGNAKTLAICAMTPSTNSLSSITRSSADNGTSSRAGGTAGSSVLTPFGASNGGDAAFSAASRRCDLNGKRGSSFPSTSTGANSSYQNYFKNASKNRRVSIQPSLGFAPQRHRLSVGSLEITPLDGHGEDRAGMYARSRNRPSL